MTDKIKNKHSEEEKNIFQRFSIFCKRKEKNFKLCKTNNNEYFYSLCSKSYTESKDFCKANDMKLLSTENSEFWKKESSGNFPCMQHLWKFWVDFESCDNEEFIKMVKEGKENCKLKFEKMQSLENRNSTALMAERSNDGGMYFKVLNKNKKKKFVCVKKTAQENIDKKIPESQTVTAEVNTTKEETDRKITAKTVSESTTKGKIDVLNPNTYVKETSKEVTTGKETDQKVITKIVTESTTKDELDVLNPNFKETSKEIMTNKVFEKPNQKVTAKTVFESTTKAKIDMLNPNTYVKETSNEVTTNTVFESTLKADKNVTAPTTPTTDSVITDTKTSGYTISPPTYIIPIFCVFVIIFVALAFRKFNKNNDSKKPKNDEEVDSEMIEMDCLLNENKS